ncbi:Site-specific recombinase XerD [Bosea sp. LC85]|uniref:tyrosine-type recombinase/integrase n=1 Tax=Bosea sp. LC85 TaxID=1502851 RepID=UPI0004E45290|nr:tyrosine-type recombinase/integrase [Bosea sp. LC85]KFC66831.1 Site-specific recombinase XerD [Bosea sp. LC85]
MAFALRMAKLTRDPKTGNWKSRKAIPEDCRGEFGKREDKPVWPAHLTETQAREAFGKWLSSVEGRISAIREGTKQPDRTTISDFEIERLAQLWLAHLMQEDEDLRSDGLSERDFRRHGETVELDDFTSAQQVARGDTSRLQDEIDDFVRSHGFDIDPVSPEHRKLSLRFLKDYRRAAKASVERQAGEIVENPKAPEDAAKLTVMGLFNSFEAAKQSRLGARTLRGYKQKLQAFSDFVGDKDARSLTDDNVYEWAAHREREDKVQPHIIQKNDVAAVSSVFGWAASKLGGRLVPANIAAEVDIKAPEPIRDREPFFTLAEVRKILKAARKAADDSTVHDARRNARRWCPWLCAYSGARITETTQLRREDFWEEGGTWFYRITPSAGSVKNRTYRRVPLHEHVIAEGFLDFLRSVKSGALFYDPSRREKEDALTSRAALESIRIAEWLRDETKIAKDVRINHAWRHTWKTEALGVEIEERIRDAIAGHSVGRTARKYEHPNGLLAAAMKRFPRYRLDDEAAPAAGEV